MQSARALSITLLMASAIVLVGLQLKPWGWLLLALSVASLLLADRKYAKDLLLIHISLAILGLTPIDTDISYGHMAQMAISLSLALAVPYAVSRFVYQDSRIWFPFHHGRGWYRSEIAYIAVTAAVSYLLIPFYLVNSGAYLNWPSAADTGSIIKLFIGTNALGIWDELFFICTVLGLLRYYFRFFWANLFQAVLFTSFLFELGFTGWGPLMVFPFALLQGYVFYKTDSLLYVVTIHLTLDFILFLALINAHNPHLVNIFLT